MMADGYLRAPSSELLAQRQLELNQPLIQIDTYSDYLFLLYYYYYYPFIVNQVGKLERTYLIQSYIISSLPS